jgi:charged multivesicular body protein 5
MRRIFGSAGPKTPKPTLEDATKKVDTKVTEIDGKIAELDKKLRVIREQMKKAKGGALTSAKTRAMQILKQKKMYERQRDQMTQQSFNMEQQSFAISSLQDTVTTVDAMKEGAKAMKKQFKKIDVDQIESLHDELEGLMEDNQDIQEVLGRSYGMEDVDETDLEAELDMLGDEMLEEALTDDAPPSYLTDMKAAPSANPVDLPAVKDDPLFDDAQMVPAKAH